jgi:hypothetical protein
MPATGVGVMSEACVAVGVSLELGGAVNGPMVGPGTDDGVGSAAGGDCVRTAGVEVAVSVAGRLETAPPPPHADASTPTRSR